MTDPSSLALGTFASAEATSPEPAPDGAGSPCASRRTAWRHLDWRGWLGLVPFFTFLGLFLVVPTIAVFTRALQSTPGAEGEERRSAMIEAITGQFRHYFWASVKLSVVSALLGGLLGVLLALIVVRLERPRWLRTIVSAFAGVAANMGGIILAFMFVATLGVQGLATKILGAVGLTVPSTFITSFWGLVVVYLFFQIPLMFLVMLPAADGLKPAWREAVANLGGTARTYWLHVGIPVLTPAALGGLLLLFASSFSAYATAFALTSQAGQLVPVQIRFYLQGNMITGQENVGYAMAAWMILLMLATIALYLALRRRAERWQR